MCVDDWTETDNSRVKLQHGLSDIMKTAAVNLTKWSSNSKLEMDSIDQMSIFITSGVWFMWATQNTECFMRLDSWLLQIHCIKQNCFIPWSMFDPMGLISPFTVTATILLQELWLRGVGRPLDSDIKKWSSWKSKLLELKDVTMWPWFGISVTLKFKIELHGFGDAFPKAHGPAVYIRVIDQLEHVSSRLVMSKSRVALIKAVSLPRLELLAAVVSARLLKLVVDKLQIKMHRVLCWIDSMVTLHWRRGRSSYWKPFIANGVAEIQSTWDPGCWSCCASKDNSVVVLNRQVDCGGMDHNDCPYLLKIK